MVVWQSGNVKAQGFLLEDLPGAIFGAVVDDDNFVRDAAEIQLEVQMLDGGRDAAFLIAGGNDDRQESEWLGRRSRQLAVFSVQFSAGRLKIQGTKD